MFEGKSQNCYIKKAEYHLKKNGSISEINIKKLFAGNLKRFRAILKISQLDLANRIELSPNAISDIEKEKKFVSEETIVKLASFFKVEPYRLFLPREKWYLPEDDIYKKDYLDSMVLAAEEHWNNYHKFIRESKEKN